MDFFSPFVNIVKTISNKIRSRSGNMVSFMMSLVSEMPSLINSIATVIEMKKSDDKLDVNEIKTLIDSALKEFDQHTGSEEGAITLFSSKNEEEKRNEEIALDALTTFMRFTLYRKYGVPFKG